MPASLRFRNRFRRSRFRIPRPSIRFRPRTRIRARRFRNPIPCRAARPNRAGRFRGPAPTPFPVIRRPIPVGRSRRNRSPSRLRIPGGPSPGPRPIPARTYPAATRGPRFRRPVFRPLPAGHPPDMTSDEQTPGTHPQVTAEDLRMLLDAGSPGTRLVLSEGRVRLATDSGEDGLELIRRPELADRIGDHPDQHELAEQAELLNTLIRLQGA